MAADENGEKTEAPTPRRRQKAEEQGQIAKSQDLVAAALIVAAMYLLNHYGHELFGVLKGYLATVCESIGSEGPPLELFELGLIGVGKAILPLLAGLLLVAILGNVGQTGLRFTPAKLQPNLMALNPFKGFGRLFGQGRNPMKFAMNLAKLLVISLIAWTAVMNRLPLILTAQQLEHQQVMGLAMDVVYAVAMRIGVALLVLAVVDFAWQKWKHERDLKMSKQDVKEEMRSQDGDPKIKQRRRQIAMQIASKRLKKDVPTADVVVTNPTEYAVALKYDSSSMHAPRVVAKGQGFLAARIRELAIEAGVPILERKPLARALYKLVAVGQEVPEQFYSAIAEILAYVYELTGKIRSGAAA